MAMPSQGGSRRPVGSPPKGQAAITEDQYPDIYSRWLRGASIHSLAREYGVDWSTLNHHLQKVRAAIRTVMARDRAEVLDELNEVRRAAWECFERSKQPMKHEELAKEMNRVAEQNELSADVAARVVKQTTKISTRDGESTWLTVVLAAIEMEAKMTGHFEAGKREGQRTASGNQYRAAGRTPNEQHEQMGHRLLAILNERRQALTGGSN